ncbi:MAG: hypothetical protein U0894_06255 [Pirellulales bacterium]
MNLVCAGAGQTVVVIDTGIAYDHKALGGGIGSHHVVGGRDLPRADANPMTMAPNPRYYVGGSSDRRIAVHGALR